jgi:hypothetical protein
MTEIDGLLRRAGVSALKSLFRRAVDNYRFTRMKADLRPVMPVRTARVLLDGLTPKEVSSLQSYLESPDFEQVMLHLIVGRSRPRRGDDDGSIREELRHGLRLHAGLSEENGYALTDLLLGAITTAVEQSGAPQAAQGQDLAGMAHRATLAVRNSELLRRVPSLAALHEEAEAMRRQVAKLHGELRLPHAGVSRSTPWSELYVTPELERLSLDELAVPGRRSVILGDPGAGKSTLARWLSYQIAVDERPRVPFLVILRDLSEALRAGERDLEDYLRGVARSPYNITMSPDTVRYLLLNGRAVVLLDGLDELTDLSLRQRVADLVDGFAALHPLVPVIVTSRRIGYTDAPLRSPGVQTGAIASFSDQQVEAYAINWFQLDDGTPPNERDNLCTAFLRDSAIIPELRSNPLLLALLCATYRTERYIPRNRAQVYERCALMLFEQWDTMRGIKMPVRFEGRVRGAVQELAWRMYAERRTPKLPRSRVLAIIARFLTGKGVDEDLARELSADFLTFCAGRAWVLAEVGTTETQPVYGFAHRTFLEFFAAEHLVRHHVTPKRVWEVLATKPLHDSSWNVVGLIALHLLERNIDDGAEQLVLTALKSAPQASTTLFLVQACQEMPLSIRSVKGISRMAYDCALRVPIRKRVPVVHVGRQDLLDDDAALSLIWATSGPNLETVVEALAELFGRGVLDRDDAACYLAEWLLLSDDSTPIQKSVAARLQADHLKALRKWRRESLMYHAYTAARSLASVDRTVGQAGVAPFYLGGVFGPNRLRPAVLWMVDGESGEAHMLRDHLIRAERPWLPPEYARDLLTEARPQRRFPSWLAATGRILAMRAILLLPYFEAMARNASFDPDALYPAFVSDMVCLRRGEREWDDGLWTDAPAECVEFIRRWAAGEFSVLG